MARACVARACTARAGAARACGSRTAQTAETRATAPGRLPAALASGPARGAHRRATRLGVRRVWGMTAVAPRMCLLPRRVQGSVISGTSPPGARAWSSGTAHGPHPVGRSQRVSSSQEPVGGPQPQLTTAGTGGLAGPLGRSNARGWATVSRSTHDAPQTNTTRPWPLAQGGVERAARHGGARERERDGGMVGARGAGWA